MIEHSQGPWECHKTKPIAGVTIERGWFITASDSRLDIAHVHLTASQEEATQEANASLIAAAPELLAACQLALPFALAALEAGIEDADLLASAQKDHRVVAALRDAIAKAEGRNAV